MTSDSPRAAMWSPISARPWITTCSSGAATGSTSRTVATACRATPPFTTPGGASAHRAPPTSAVTTLSGTATPRNAWASPAERGNRAAPPQADAPRDRWTSRSVSRVLFPGALRRSRSATIHLDVPSPARSSGPPAGSGGQPSNACALPSRTNASRELLDLAPGGVYRAVPVTRDAGGLLHHRFTLTGSPSRETGGLFSVALSRGSRRVAVDNHPALWSPDFPRRPTDDRPGEPERTNGRATRPPDRLVRHAAYRATPGVQSGASVRAGPMCGRTSHALNGADSGYLPGHERAPAGSGVCRRPAPVGKSQAHGRQRHPDRGLCRAARLGRLPAPVVEPGVRRRADHHAGRAAAAAADRGGSVRYPAAMAQNEFHRMDRRRDRGRPAAGVLSGAAEHGGRVDRGVERHCRQ